MNIRRFIEFIFIWNSPALFLLPTQKIIDMKRVSTTQKDRLPYAVPLIELIDVQTEKGFADSFPGGDVEPMSSVWRNYDESE